MPQSWHMNLSRRERQIMESVYEKGEMSVSDVLAALPNPPGYSAVRAMLRILEDKGLLTHRKVGPRYVYSPTLPRGEAARSALRQLVRTFFDGSAEDAVAALLSASETHLTDEDLARLARLIDEARKEGR